MKTSKYKAGDVIPLAQSESVNITDIDHLIEQYGSTYSIRKYSCGFIDIHRPSSTDRYMVVRMPDAQEDGWYVVRWAEPGEKEDPDVEDVIYIVSDPYPSIEVALVVLQFEE